MDMKLLERLLSVYLASIPNRKKKQMLTLAVDSVSCRPLESAEETI
jgi:hypothetical protein